MVYIIIKACPNQFLTVLSTHPTPLLPRHHSRPFPLSEYAQSAKNWNERNKQSINKSMTTKMADEYPERLLGPDGEGWLFYLAFLIFRSFLRFLSDGFSKRDCWIPVSSKITKHPEVQRFRSIKELIGRASISKSSILTSFLAECWLTQNKSGVTWMERYVERSSKI